MKVRVDKGLCSGHARCNAVGPDLFELDDEGYCSIGEIEVPANLEGQARAGEANCPERAISLIE
jgi:ferredoxin